VRILAVIPARGGSKGVPGKNARALGPLPLVGWSVRSAYRSRLVTDVVVSTDDTEIESAAHDTADMCQVTEYQEIVRRMRAARAQASWDGSAWSAEQPLEAKRFSVIRRPAELATDDASIDDVLLHAVEAVDVPDVVVTLQPTQPFRAAWLVDACIQRLRAEKLDSVWTGRWAGIVYRPDEFGLGLRCVSPLVQRQHVRTDRYDGEDGACFVTRAGWLLAARSRRGGRTAMVERTDWRDLVDIDEPGDWLQAEHLYQVFWRLAEPIDDEWRPYRERGMRVGRVA
jgi:CMP-N,N'-diacetyllegionaminic acid synthase